MGQTVLVIGGGASGLMAAIAAARGGAKVTVLEANDRPGRKLLASGNGKCNLTNLDQDIRHYHTDDPAFVNAVLDHFPVESAIAFFTSLGLAMHNRDGWVYPVTEQSLSVLKLLLYEAENLGVRIKTKERVTRVEAQKDGRFRVYTATWQYESDRVIVSCGSPASAVRGSSGDAAVFAEESGIAVRPFLPSLVPLKIRGDICGKWAGVRVNGAVTLLVDGKASARDAGNIQLTDYGVSGIPVLQISHEAVRALSLGRDVRVLLDLFPDESADGVRDRLLMRERLCPYKSLKQQLTGLIPEQLISALCRRNDSLETVARKLKASEYPVVSASSIRHAQVCQGGVLTSELTECMESARCPGLYFTGEAVDVDGECGGYNLQWAWSSGWAAGSGASGK